MKITGKDLALARIILGYETQQKFADFCKVSVTKIQRYEALKEVDAKILGYYHFDLRLDIKYMKFQIEGIRRGLRLGIPQDTDEFD